MSTIVYEKRDGIGYVTLNRPEELNAMNDEMLSELDELLPQLEMDLEAKVIVFNGAGRDFCVGQDLTGVNTLEVLSEPGEHITIKKRMEAERRRNRRWEIPGILAGRHGWMGNGLQSNMLIIYSGQLQCLRVDTRYA